MRDVDELRAPTAGRLLALWRECRRAEDPTVCLVEFGFAVAHGLNQVRLTVHIEI